MSNFDQVIEECKQKLEYIANDNSVPRNIRRSANDILETLSKKDEPLFLRTSASISVLEDISNDPNIPVHTRTLIWDVASQLETIPVDE
jgi:hypothetical protein